MERKNPNGERYLEREVKGYKRPAYWTSLFCPKSTLPPTCRRKMQFPRPPPERRQVGQKGKREFGQAYFSHNPSIRKSLSWGIFLKRIYHSLGNQVTKLLRQEKGEQAIGAYSLPDILQMPSQLTATYSFVFVFKC